MFEKLQNLFKQLAAVEKTVTPEKRHAFSDETLDLKPDLLRPGESASSMSLVGMNGKFLVLGKYFVSQVYSPFGV